MAKVKLSVIKLFDNRKPLCHNNCGRQLRSCSCFLEIKNKDPAYPIHSVNKIATKIVEDNSFQEIKSKMEPQSESESSSTKENKCMEEVNKNLNEIIDNVEFEEEEGNLVEMLSEVQAESSELDITSNSISYNFEGESLVSSDYNTSNSSWNNASPVSPPKQEPKCVRNEFPTVFNKCENTECHMNLCSDGNDIVIPIPYVRRHNDIRSQGDKCQTMATAETCTDYDLDSDRLNTSLVEFKCTPNDKNNSRLSSCKLPLKYANRTLSVSDDSNKCGLLIMFAYISDVHSVEDSLILNKDRRFCRILDQYKCSASIVQMNNMSRGFPHTLLKITGASKVGLQYMSREADKIHPHWNLRSQLRSVHA